MNNEETTVFISDADQYVFGQGTHYEIYKKLGAHFCKKGNKDGVFFAVWAPNAKEVFVIGEFNGWDEGNADEASWRGRHLCHFCSRCRRGTDVQIYAGACGRQKAV